MVQSMRSHRGNALLVCLSVANLVGAGSVLVSLVNVALETGDTPPPVCTFQGLGVTLATCSSVLWSAAISLYILAVMRVKARGYMTKLVWGSHCVCWGYPAICGVVVLGLEIPFKFEPGKWCVIKEFDSTQNRINLPIQLAVLDAPVGVAMVVGLVAYLFIFYIGWQTKSQGLVGKLAFIPIVAIVCRLPGFLTRTLEYQFPDDGSHSWAAGLEALLDPAQGGINTIMFLLVGLLRVTDLNRCGKLCRACSPRKVSALNIEPLLPAHARAINSVQHEEGTHIMTARSLPEFVAWDEPSSEARLSVFAQPPDVLDDR